MLKNLILANFKEITSLLTQLEPKRYIQTHIEIGNVSIGEHIRHILEMYQILLEGYEKGIVNYDNRKRDFELQNNLVSALNLMKQIADAIDMPNKELLLVQKIDAITLRVSSNYERELLYNLEHSIHHQALIKVVVLKYKDILLPQGFGVAKSTLQFRNTCVQ